MVIIGVDPHPGSHTAAALDPNGMLLDTLSVSNNGAGLAQLERWAWGFEERRWAIEGAGNPFVASLVGDLLARGEQVVNIHPGLTSQYRARRSKKKNDLIDAVNVARACLANPDLPPYKLISKQRLFQELSRNRDRLAKELKANRMALRDANHPVVRQTIESVIGALEVALKALEAELRKQLDELAPELLETRGLGVVLAGSLLAEVGDPRRFADEDCFASYCGAAPVVKGSGKTLRVEVSREGNRRLNRLLHLVVQTRLRSDGGRSRAYLDRKVAAGKTQRKALRALKTYVARELYRLLIVIWDRRESAALTTS